MASNLAELEAVIDTHKGGLGIGADPTYKTAAGGSLSKPSAVVYLNAGSLLKAARGLLKSPPAAALNGPDARRGAAAHSRHDHWKQPGGPDLRAPLPPDRLTLVRY